MRSVSKTLAAIGLGVLVATTGAPAWSESPPAEREHGTDETVPVYRPAGAESGSQAPKTASMLLYVPPDLGLPESGRVGAGTRGAGRQYSLHVLAPDHIGLTTEAQPTLYWFLSRPTSIRVEVTVRDEKSVAPLLETQLPVPVAQGVHAVRLADHGVRLEPGRNYQWFVSLVPDPEHRSKDFIAGGWLRCEAPEDGLRAQLEGTAPERSVYVYARNGIWYDAIASISAGIEDAPHDPALRGQRAALLDQVGLSEVADYDRAQAGPR
jgi:hypothetical protein